MLPALRLTRLLGLHRAPTAPLIEDELALPRLDLRTGE